MVLTGSIKKILTGYWINELPFKQKYRKQEVITVVSVHDASKIRGNHPDNLMNYINGRMLLPIRLIRW